ncbi:sporulation membrane protein YtaF [Clostridium sp. YIM B02515]|uniref:Sporulation membrane protein YtaF n=1 Tax=Clostridium rhizosphaerae TaxID=2803861 RepID=A0ABS1TEV4_9CLOT|nr:sporulation membrane protein YtaF [Clostridium rhizosphaerae]MBL4937131.1 sporulation membrane protein YtaF [Clostridium rhizosphaerae]
MHILSSFLFAFSANIDNLAVGIAYGIKNLKINILKSAIVAFMSCLGTFGAMMFGKAIYHLVPKHLTNSLGSIVLICLGLWSLYEAFKTNNKNSYEQIMDDPEKIDKDKSGIIDTREALVLGLALAVNNIGMGIGASITGINLWITSLLTFIFSFVFIPLGIFLGQKYFSNLIGKFASILSGIIIICLAIYELFI